MRSWWRWGLVVILRRFSWNQLDEESDEDKDVECHVISSPCVMSFAVHQKENVFLYHGINTLTRFP